MPRFQGDNLRRNLVRPVCRARSRFGSLPLPGAFYLFAETGEAARWVRNIRHEPKVTVRIGDCRIEAVARVLDPQTDRSLGDQVAAIAKRKYGWGDGLPVEVTPCSALQAIRSLS